MRYLDEFREPEAARRLCAALRQMVTRPWHIMEVCGGQTHAILRYGIDQLLPAGMILHHGPGCPVCVTPVELVDKAIALAERPEVIFCSFGDMLRVPGSREDLFAVKARGGDVRVVYSPLDAVEIARQHQQRQVVFFAIGFETTAPANAMALRLARQQGVENFSLLVSQFLVPPAIRVVMGTVPRLVQGFLAAGHVCAITGYAEYEPLARELGLPIVVTGFEPVDILQGIALCAEMLEKGEHGVRNAYRRAVQRDGNRPARQVMEEVFMTVDREWRGLGVIPASGLGLRPEWAAYDAEKRFAVQLPPGRRDDICISGLVLQGLRKPTECPAFGGTCTPDHPLGATMVSSEGACAAYYRFRKRDSR